MGVELKPLPPTFVDTRNALHRVAEELVAPARKPHNEIALRQTPGGFGTPAFQFDGSATRVRVEGVELVVARDRAEERVELHSLAAGGALLGRSSFPMACRTTRLRSGSTARPPLGSPTSTRSQRTLWGG